MRKQALPNCPQWLLDAHTIGEDVDYGVYHIIIWKGGTWKDGTWKDGIWTGGIWEGGTWKGPENRLLYMASLLGIVFDAQDKAVGYRSVTHELTGKYTPHWTQPLGSMTVDHLPAGSGTCCKGLHVTSAGRAYTYFGVDPKARLIRVTFGRAQLLDCDGEKARLSGGFCEEIPWPFLGQKGG